MPSPASPIPLPQRLSLITQTAESLRSHIAAGHWQGHLPGERTLCSHFQVSRQTIRAALRVLEREQLVSVSKRKRRQIGTPLTGVGKVRHTSLVVALSPRPLVAMSPSSVVMVDQLRADLAQAGLSLEIHVSSACFSDHPARTLEEITMRLPAAAWLLFGSREPMQHWFVAKGIPCLVVGSCAPAIPLPSFDSRYRAVCRHAGAMLRRKGHRCLALVRPEGAYGGETESEAGLREALEGGQPPLLEVIRHDGSPDHICALLDKALQSKNPPTAFIVARAMHVLTVMMHLMGRGLRIPRDIAVVSRDDESFLHHVVPAVTRYATSPDQFARRVSAAVLLLAKGSSLPGRAHLLMPKLIAGGTV